MKSTLVFAAAFVFVLSFCAFARSQEVAEPDGAASAQSADGWSSPDKAGARMEIEIEGVKTAFRWCPPGSFTRHWSKGTESYWEEPVNQFDEEADYTITLTQGFWFAETETTQELWKAVTGKNLGWIARTDNIPMGLSWEGMQEFISKLNDGGYAPNGFEFRLPTEAQWEYACMAGTTGERYGELDAIAWHEGNARGSQNEVGQKEPNAWGLYDMLGNAWEWCSDWYGRYPNRNLTDYVGPQKGLAHVVRGGWGFPGWAPAGWVTSVESCSRTCRGAKDQGVVRLVLVPEGQKSSQDALASEVVESAENDEASAPDAVASDSNATDWASPGKAGARMEVEINGVKAAFRWCPPGNLARRWSKGTERFWEKQTDWDDDKQDFDVALTQGFWLAETETTQELWEAVTGDNPSEGVREEKIPVNNVSWDETQEFISKLNDGGYAPNGFEFRLPTEAQWEYACIADSQEMRNNLFALDAIAWHTSNSEGRAHEVGLKKANDWGLYDMLGNVWEWCGDWYEKYPMEDLVDYAGPQEGATRVCRGGCWRGYVQIDTVNRKGVGDSDARSAVHGFRLALVPKDLICLHDAVAITDDSVSTQNAEGWSSPGEAGARMEVEIKGVKTAFRWAPPGSFTRQWNMWTGRFWEVPFRRRDAEKDFKITLTQGFWLAETETTQELWEAVMLNYNPSEGVRTGKTPVNNVSRDEIQRFISKLNAKGYAPAGFEFRLPTEAQWEYACMAGTTGERYGKASEIAWYEGNSEGRAHEVGQKEPNAWGLYDMLGNVWEWCDGLYEMYPMSNLTDYAGPKKSSRPRLVIRGGGWQTGPEGCSRYSRVYSEYRSDKSNRGVHIGFRLALVPKDLICSHDVSASDGAASTQGAEDRSSSNDAVAPMEIDINGVKVAFCWAPPGSFTRHWNKKSDYVWEKKALSDDDAQDFEITLTRGFWLAETETTQELWKAVTGNNPSLEERTRKRPVNNVSWDDAQEFISKLNDGGYAPAGFEFRLPTEAQWEYACMAGTTDERYGDLYEIAWYQDNWGGNFSANEVGLKKPNAWGLYDMLGNIEEWCYDRYEKYPMKDLTDYAGPQEGPYHVIRGCNWDDLPSFCRRSYRTFCHDGHDRSCWIGFRLAIVPKEK